MRHLRFEDEESEGWGVLEALALGVWSQESHTAFDEKLTLI